MRTLKKTDGEVAFETEQHYPVADFLEKAKAHLNNRFFRVNFDKLRIYNASLAGCILAECTFRHTTFENVDFEAASIRHSTFHGAMLLDCNFAFATLFSTDFRDCNITRANFTDTSIEGGYIIDSVLRMCQFDSVKFEKVTLSGRADGTRFIGVEMSHLDYRGLDMTRALLRDATILGCKVEGYICIGPIGSRLDRLHVFKTGEGPILSTGCFTGDIDEFEDALDVTHNTGLHRATYENAVKFIREHFRYLQVHQSSRGQTVAPDATSCSVDCQEDTIQTADPQSS